MGLTREYIEFQDARQSLILRMPAYASHAARRMKTKVAKNYLRIVDEVLRRMNSQQVVLTDNSLLDVLDCVGEVFDRVPQIHYDLMSKLNGQLAAETEARRWAIQHMVDLVYSYRRFYGIVPFGDDDTILQQHARSVVSSHLKSLADNT